jgi:hypothetical protein
MPDASKEEDFEAHRHGDIADDAFNAIEHKGTVQVHRADPGSIYVTLHEGKDNPTYTLKHVFGTGWRGMPKKKKAPKLDGINPAVISSSFKAAIEKHASIPSAGNAAFHSVMGLGKTQPWWINGVFGAGLGGLYHGARQSLYNTPEENAEENSDPRTLLRRMGIPAAGLAAAGALQRNAFPNYYSALTEGKKLDPFN